MMAGWGGRGEATSICSGRQADRGVAANSAIRRASISPCSPVQALALPAQTMKPRATAGRQGVRRAG